MRISPPDPITDNAALLAAFRAHLRQRDLAPTTVENYLHDLKLFQDWLAWLYEAPAIALRQVATADLATFRQHLLQEKSQRPTTINRRLQSLRLFYRWLKPQHAAAEDPAEHLRYLRTVRRPQPAALKRPEALALVRAAATSPHGMAKRNVALVQLLLQTGLRDAKTS